MSNGVSPRIDKPNFMFDNWGRTETAIVQQDETSLAEVAKRLGLSLESLLEANPQIKNPAQLTPGQELNLPDKLSVVTLPGKPPASSEQPEAGTGSIVGERNMDGVMMRASLNAFFRTGNAEEKPEAEKREHRLWGDEPEEPKIPYEQSMAFLIDSTVSVSGRMGTLGSRLDAAKISPKLRDELKAQLDKQQSIPDMKPVLDQVDAALASKDPASAIKSIVIQGRVKDYYKSFESTYEVNGKQVKAAPHFRVTAGYSGHPGRTHATHVVSDLSNLLGKHMKLTPQLRTAIGAVAYGRATADQIKMVTDGLLKSGQFKVAKAMHPGLSDEETIRMMQWDHGVGIDCAGYVQQAFMKVHGGKRSDFGFKSFGNEDLSSLKGNPNFTQVKPIDIKPGDLIILDPPQRGDVGHTVLVRDRHVASADELKKYVDSYGFANPGDPVHIVQVDASWGAGADGLLSGGVQSKIWFYNEKTGKWADAFPDGKGRYSIIPSDRNGPYNHPMNGIFRPKRSQ